jgi:hypothetical protein
VIAVNLSLPKGICAVAAFARRLMARRPGFRAIYRHNQSGPQEA